MEVEACDKPHYPYQLPEGWEWCKLEDLAYSITDGDHQAPPKVSNGIPFLVISDVTSENIDFSNTRYVSQDYYDAIQFHRKPKCGDILFTVTGSYGIVVKVSTDKQFCFQRHIGLIKPIVDNDYLVYVLRSQYVKKLCDDLSTGTAQKTVGLDTLRYFMIPIPPLQEQSRIVKSIEHWLSLVDCIEENKNNLQKAIKQAKSKILDLAIHGKLVPQDQTDEPAIELLKRINPKAEIACDNGQYGKLPKGWAVCRLEDVVEYEQPTAYIVSSTDYDDTYSTPVLTAGKSFIIGYTNDDEGIFSNLPCIIFDDFTTDSKMVNFPFKVKSSAMKILKVHNDVDIEYVASFMSITRLIGDTHKRYWISEYSKLELPLPPYNEQVRIMNKIKLLFERLDSITENI